MLELNKNKICFLKRISPGNYKLGDISICQIWHSEGVCRNSYMWHVIINHETVISWAYLKDAKKSAVLIDHKAKELDNIEDVKKLVYK